MAEHIPCGSSIHRFFSLSLMREEKDDGWPRTYPIWFIYEEVFSLLPLKRLPFGFPLCLSPNSLDRKYIKSECILKLQRTENPTQTDFNKGDFLPSRSGKSKTTVIQHLGNVSIGLVSFCLSVLPSEACTSSKGYFTSWWQNSILGFICEQLRR